MIRVVIFLTMFCFYGCSPQVFINLEATATPQKVISEKVKVIDPVIITDEKAVE